MNMYNVNYEIIVATFNVNDFLFFYFYTAPMMTNKISLFLNIERITKLDSFIIQTT